MNIAKNLESFIHPAGEFIFVSREELPGDWAAKISNAVALLKLKRATYIAICTPPSGKFDDSLPRLAQVRLNKEMEVMREFSKNFSQRIKA